jgi:hypothetical protein
MERSGKGTSDEGWWQASDGRRYPAGMAHHPAARPGVAGPGTPRADGGRHKPSWRAWAILLLPLLTLLLMVLAAVDAASDPADVDTAAGGDPPDPSPLSPDDLVTTTSTAAPTTTPPDLTMTPAVPTPQRPPPVPPVSVTAPSTTGPTIADRHPASTGTDTAASATTPPSTPTSRSDCRHGGWRTLVDHDGRAFRSQGDCVSSVSRG